MLVPFLHGTLKNIATASYEVRRLIGQIKFDHAFSQHCLQGCASVASADEPPSAGEYRKKFQL